MEKFAIAAPLCALTRCKICDSGALQWTGSPLSAESRGSCRGSAPFGSFLSTSGCKKKTLKTPPSFQKFAIVGPSHTHYIEKVHGNIVFVFPARGSLVPEFLPDFLLDCCSSLLACKHKDLPLSAGSQRHGGGSGLWPYGRIHLNTHIVHLNTNIIQLKRIFSRKNIYNSHKTQIST